MTNWARAAAAVVMCSVVGLQLTSLSLGSRADMTVRESRRIIQKIEDELARLDDPEDLEPKLSLFELTRQSEREYVDRSIKLHEIVEKQRRLLLVSHLILGVTGFVIIGIAFAPDRPAPPPPRG